MNKWKKNSKNSHNAAVRSTCTIKVFHESDWKISCTPHYVHVYKAVYNNIVFMIMGISAVISNKSKENIILIYSTV